VQDIDPPITVPGGVIIDVHRAGVCGTDVEFYTGQMPYLHEGHAHYPMRLGHEWMGTVSAVGDGVDPSWLYRRVTGDTMLGCGTCLRCLKNNQRVCDFRFEVGIRGGFPGALAEQLAMPVTALHALPDSVDDALGALVEPGGNALRSVWGAQLSIDDRALVLGPGTIGLLVAMFAKAAGAEVHLMGRSARSLDFARSLGFDGVWTEENLPDLPWDAVIDATNSPAQPARALELVEPAKRIVFIGLAGSPSLIDTRKMVLKDVTSVGILSASLGLAGTIDVYASAAFDPHQLVAATVGLDGISEILAGVRPEGAGMGPKMHIDPRI
jgi:threonine dehydrogenase-like Zn-dependent dehydrogenase